MKETLAVAILLALMGIVTLQTTSQAMDEENSCLAVIKAWEASEKLNVSPKAEQAIAFAFAQYGPEFLHGDTVWEGSPRTRKQTFLICYLDRLRDRFPSFEAVGAAYENRLSSEYREMKLEDGGNFDIERFDVARYTVESFMKDIRPLLTGHAGELVVVSEQVPSVVSVDDYEVRRASTVSVELAGEHHIVVHNNARRCEAKVKVVDGASTILRCP
jgi:hypothetical protein